MELSKDFRQSVLGVIPSKWEVVQLGQICVKIQDGTHFSPTLGGNDYLYVTSKNIRPGRLDLSTAERISADEHRKIYGRCDTRRGDILLTKDGANTGNAALNTLDEEVSLLSSVAFLRFNDLSHDPRFFLQQLLADSGQARMREMMSGNAITRLTLEKIRAFEVVVPPLAEQKAIAEALSDADALVESLDALIAKKRDMKQAAMQQLLTGRTRLPGFTDEWTEISYNEMAWHKAGNGSLIKGKVYQESGAGRISAFSASGQDVWCEVAEYTEPGLVISAVGSRCGKVFRAQGSWTAIANTHVLFAEKSRCSTDFLWFRVNEEKFWVKGGTGQPFVLVRESLKRRERWPTLDEQVRIAEILMDMDAEIDALVAQREKAELVKQGMMQELLSGRVRLA